jgi:hypothetical protein
MIVLEVIWSVGLQVMARDGVAQGRKMAQSTADPNENREMRKFDPKWRSCEMM